jgi:hypothetical protein
MAMLQRRVKGGGFRYRFRCRRISAAAAVPLSAARQPRWQAIQEHWLQHCYRSFAAGRGTPMAAPAADTMGEPDMPGTI